MRILEHISLKDYSTMQLGGEAVALTSVTNRQELTEAIAWAEAHDLPILVLGGGSNVIFQDGFDGLVMVNEIHGFEVLGEDDASTTIRIGAGEVWDDVVASVVHMNLSGIEKLSLIPGSTGATPVQNVGAYGAEIADTLVELEAYDTKRKQFAILSNQDCRFSYRNSIFKSTTNRRYIIVSITLKLSKQPPKQPFYASLQRYLDEHHTAEYTPQTIRQAVIAIRNRTLPDPALIPNTGSFFKNPIVPHGKLNQLQQAHPNMPFFEMKDNKVKLLAGWLIDQAGLKGYRAHGMKTYEHNALVFINESAKSYDDLAAFRQEIVDKVEATFGVRLEQEPELL